MLTPQFIVVVALLGHGHFCGVASPRHKNVLNSMTMATSHQVLIRNLLIKTSLYFL